ncbi:MAG: hypothetical protein OER95_08510, partial [Acidimicrobiia bacterium]|nr:hypothetical protein [Acidimicrobiia bacterium]
MRSRREAGPSDVEPDQIVVSCVFECGRHLGLEAILLYRSLDSSEGRLAKAKRRAYCVGALDPAVARPLEALSVDLVQTGPVLADTPLANKIRMFDCRPGEKVLVALDTDIVVVGELWPWVSDEVVGAKPVDQNPFSATHWRHIHRHLGLDEPSTRYRTHFDHELTPPYFNSGVIIMPGKWASDVAAIWTERTAILNRDLAAIDPGLEQYSYYTAQLAF